MYPANLWPHKNHARLLEAFARVRERDVHLVLTGQEYGRRGVDMGPSAFRIAGLSERLGALGMTVVDEGDLVAPIRGGQPKRFGECRRVDAGSSGLSSHAVIVFRNPRRAAGRCRC